MDPTTSGGSRWETSAAASDRADETWEAASCCPEAAADRVLGGPCGRLAWRMPRETAGAAARRHASKCSDRQTGVEEVAAAAQTTSGEESERVESEATAHGCLVEGDPWVGDEP